MAGFSSSQFSFAANQFTFNGINQGLPSNLIAAVSLLGAGTTVTYEVAIFINGSVFGTGMTCNASSTDRAFVQSLIPRPLQTGDIIEMQVRNITDGTDVTVTDAQLTIG